MEIMNQLENLGNMLTIQNLRAFIDERPLLTALGISKEAGIKSDSLLNKVLKGDRNLTQKVIDKILPVLKKYGYVESESN